MQLSTLINKNSNFALVFLFLLHFVGIFALNFEITQWLFRPLIPLNLIISGILILYNHSDWNKNFIIFAILTAFLGYLFEVIGVNTGLIFGEYQYGKNMGFKLFETPLLIGLNWLILVYSFGIIINSLSIHLIFKILITAFCLTTLDFFIEPFAIYHDMWHWQNIIVPLQNYIGWFFCSIILSSIFFILKFSKQNSLTKHYIIIQVMFFILNYVIINY
ncbi:MAG: hypothetical protein RLZZ175_1445 [Bacteroidota bacterium]|jgi:uncharacterized membrane protein